MRADQLLVERGLAASRSQAQRLIAAGVQWRLGAQPWRPLTKSGEVLPLDAQLQLLDDRESKYVSRGGLKLEGALQSCRLDVTGLRCLDVGQSTGGFTDCLLAHGAGLVVGVDVGHNQLAARLRNHDQVVCLEGINARHLSPALLDTPELRAKKPYSVCSKGNFDTRFDLVVGDVSFISLTLVLPALATVLVPSGQLLMLVKPQFELQPADIGKGGVVKDPLLYLRVEEKIRCCCAELGFASLNWLDSPILGGDGNREFFIHATIEQK